MTPNRLLPLCLLAAGAVISPVAGAANLVVNGDFESGVSGFTSEYSLAASNTAEGQFAVLTNPFPWNPLFVSAADHTPGAGTRMFVGNGGPRSGQVVWRSSSIDVAAGTKYFFEAWVMNVCCNANYTGPNSASILDFSIDLGGGNQVLLGTRTTDLGKAGTWEFLSTEWTSGGAGSLNLLLINRNTAAGGNDFAIDDITFSTVSQAVVPEPATLGLLGAALVGLFGARRRRG